MHRNDHVRLGGLKVAPDLCVAEQGERHFSQPPGWREQRPQVHKVPQHRPLRKVRVLCGKAMKWKSGHTRPKIHRRNGRLARVELFQGGFERLRARAMATSCVGHEHENAQFRWLWPVPALLQVMGMEQVSVTVGRDAICLGR